MPFFHRVDFDDSNERITQTPFYVLTPHSTNPQVKIPLAAFMLIAFSA